MALLDLSSSQAPRRAPWGQVPLDEMTPLVA
jgi:hypothetical protein